MVRQPPVGQGPLIIEDSWTHSDTRTLGRTPLDEWSPRRRDLYLKTHNTHNRHISKPLVGIRTRNSSNRAAAKPRL